MEKKNYIIGQRGHLATQLASQHSFLKMLRSNELEKIEYGSKVIYTSFFKGNSFDYQKKPAKYLSKNFNHLTNVVNLTTDKDCSVYFIGSTSGVCENGKYEVRNQGYGLNKAIASLIAAEADYIKLCNIVLPSVIGYPISQKPQIFEQLISEACFHRDLFLKKYENFNHVSNRLSLITIEQATEGILEIFTKSKFTNGNIFISPTYVVTIGEIYRAIKKVVLDAKMAHTEFEEYAHKYVQATKEKDV